MSWIDQIKKEREENIKRTPEVRSEYEKLLRELYEEIRNHGQLEKTIQLIVGKVFWVYLRTFRGRRFVLKCEYPSRIEVCELASEEHLDSSEESLGAIFDSNIFSDLYDIVSAETERSNVRKYEENIRKIRDRLGRI